MRGRRCVVWPPEVKERLCEAQNHRCPLCGKRMTVNGAREDYPTIEHIKSLFRGGADHIDNVAITCRGCNESRDPYLPIL